MQSQIHKNQIQEFYKVLNSSAMITQQTWLNLRVEYSVELAHQFEMREQADKTKPGKEYKKITQLIDNSCRRCRAMDLIIQSNVNNFKEME